MDLLGTQLWNGLHYESIKSSLSFVNEGFYKELKFDDFEIKNYQHDSVIKFPVAV